MKTIFITGIAGMIGFHSARKFKTLGWEVIGCDNFNDYYDIDLKKERARILKEENIRVINSDIRDTINFNNVLENSDVMLHLAAYANPRHAMEEPQLYIDTNITGTQRLVEVAEQLNLPVVYASSSCVMHGQPLPWNEHDVPGHQNNPYGWSKRVNECQFMHSKIDRTIGLRFFTVYGPYGRPDMALFKFAEAIVKGTPMTLYNFGEMKRDFTYVDDIIHGVDLVVNKITSENSSWHEIYNIGYGEQVHLLDFVDEIEKNLGRTTERNLAPRHPADVPETWSDTTKLQALGYKPTTSVKDGVKEFIEWFTWYYEVN